jgi:hypothetical protein
MERMSLVGVSGNRWVCDYVSGPSGGVFFWQSIDGLEGSIGKGIA